MNAPKLFPRTLEDLFAASCEAFHYLTITSETASPEVQRRQRAWMDRIDARAARMMS